MTEWLIVHTVSVALLAGAALALGRLGRLGPAARHALWVVVLVKLLVPPLVAWPWEVPVSLGRPPPTHPATPPTVEEVLFVAVLPEEASEPEEASPALPVDASPAPTSGPARPVPWLLVGGIVWLAGAVGLAGRQLWHTWHLQGQFANSSPPPGWLREEVERLADRLGIHAPPVAVVEGLGSPVIWAGGRPRLLWPAGLEGRLSPEGRRAVLVHELAHLGRRDHWVGWLILVAGWAWWWHPLCWLARRRLGREAELACDAWVVRVLPETRRAYAEALLEVCQRQSWVAATPAHGVAGRRAELERRLRMVLCEPATRGLSRRVVIALGVLALLTLPAWSLGQADPEPAAKKPAPETTYNEVLNAYSSALRAAAESTSPTSRDKKVAELEARVRALLKEIEALRGRKPTMTTRPGTSSRSALTPSTLSYAADYYRLSVAAATRGNEITLSRATYTLPEGKAKALGAFLSENVEGSVLETRVDGDKLIVTTTPQTQQAIRQFIPLVGGARGAKKSGTR